MAVTASMVARLRAKTGAGMLDCKKMLEEAEGDMVRATELLRERGIAKAAKRAGKITSEGVIVSYIHGAGRVGVLVEVNSETDFVARNEQFQALTRDIAMHIAATGARYVSRDEVPSDIVAKEKELFIAELKNEGKPDNIILKILDGKMNKFYAEVCLLEQKFIKDDEKTIEQLLIEKIGEIGEKISVRRFTRYELGEGIEKEVVDFVSEVQAQAGM